MGGLLEINALILHCRKASPNKFNFKHTAHYEYSQLPNRINGKVPDPLYSVDEGVACETTREEGGGGGGGGVREPRIAHITSHDRPCIISYHRLNDL